MSKLDTILEEFKKCLRLEQVRISENHSFTEKIVKVFTSERTMKDWLKLIVDEAKEEGRKEIADSILNNAFNSSDELGLAFSKLHALILSLTKQKGE